MDRRVNHHNSQQEGDLSEEERITVVPPTEISAHSQHLPTTDNYTKGEADRLLELGAQQHQNGQVEASRLSFHQALTVYSELQDPRGAGRTLSNLGLVYYALGNFAKAVEYSGQSLAIAQSIKDQRLESQALGNIGNAYRHLGNHAKAIEF